MKKTKENGRNVKIDLRSKKLSLNQSDQRDDFWCERCEESSAGDDSYGAAVLLHATEGVLVEKKTQRGTPYRVLQQLDYVRFKKFVLSIPLREQFARMRAGSELLLNDRQTQKLIDAYDGRTEDIGIAGWMFAADDLIADFICPPVLLVRKDGANFQLLRFSFFVYFDKSRPEVAELSFKTDGNLVLIEPATQQNGSQREFHLRYREMMDDPVNRQAGDKIIERYVSRPKKRR